MPFRKFTESMRDSSNRLDGFETGRLIVDVEAKSVELEQEIKGKTAYLPLSSVDKIEVRITNDYSPVTFNEALTTLTDGGRGSLFAGLYARVKKGAEPAELEAVE